MMQKRAVVIATVVPVMMFFFQRVPVSSQTGLTGPDKKLGILVMSKTPDYRHDSIPAGNRAIKRIGKKFEDRSDVDKVRVDIVDSEGTYSEKKPIDFPSDASVLKNRYDVLVFNNSNDLNSPQSTEILVLNKKQHQAFKKFIRAGGGFVGIHSAVDNMTADSFYSRVLGGYFRTHAPYQPGRLNVTDRSHPSTEKLPEEWEIKSEWYQFLDKHQENVNVLMKADASSYDGDKKEGFHPMAWYQKVAGGRSWYTALGHASEHFKNRHVLNHLRGGIRWAAGLESTDPGDKGSKRKQDKKKSIEQTIVIEGDDQMQFNRDRFTVTAGSKVKLKLKHVGRLPVQAMGHNVVILKHPDVQPMQFAQKAQSEGGDVENEYLPESVRDEVVAFTELIGGGEEASVVFTVPEEPGDYPFLCTFPQHASTMKGNMVVEEK